MVLMPEMDQSTLARGFSIWYNFTNTQFSIWNFLSNCLWSTNDSIRCCAFDRWCWSNRVVASLVWRNVSTTLFLIPSENRKCAREEDSHKELWKGSSEYWNWMTGTWHLPYHAMYIIFQAPVDYLCLVVCLWVVGYK